MPPNKELVTAPSPATLTFSSDYRPPVDVVVILSAFLLAREDLCISFVGQESRTIPRSI
jgi:hypothetical protein